jgi:Icc-related predicted phosphoesterase
MMDGKATYWIGFGDIHEKPAMIREIDIAPSAQGILIAGDLTNVGGKNAASRVIDEIEKINPRIYAQIGNMDTREADAFLTERGVNTHAATVDLGCGVGLIGLGYSTPTPFNTPSEASEEQLFQWLAQARAGADGYDHLVFMTHTPPMGTKTDRISSGQSVGSTAVRKFIEDTQPDVCLTGHIHEAKSVDQIGNTRIVNPGLFEAGGYAVIRLEHGRLTIRLEQIEI